MTRAQTQPLVDHAAGGDPSQDGPRSDVVAVRSVSEGLGPTWVAESTTFIGRNEAIDEVCRYLAEGARLISILGTAGIGKTRLARRVGRLLQERGIPVWFCDLSTATSPDDLVRIVAQTLGISQLGCVTDGEASAQIGRAIASRGHMVLLLDNFDQSVEHVTVTVSVWLDLAKTACILTTSRVALGLAEEVRLTLGPLTLDEARALLIERVRKLRPSFCAENQLMLNRIVEHLDCIPLAIELAASRMGLLSPSDLLARMSTRFELLRTTQRDVAVHHRTLEAALDLSWFSLTRFEQEALVQCVVFRGGFTLCAAEAILRLARAPETPAVIDVLQALLDKSLLFRSAQPEMADNARLGMYECIREYAVRKSSPDAVRKAEALHAGYYVEQAESWAENARGMAWRASRAWLMLEFDNLSRVIKQSGVEAALRLRAALSLDPLLEEHGPFKVRLSLLEHVAPLAAQASDPKQTIVYLCARADARRVLSLLPAAQQDLEQALALALKAERPDMQAEVLIGMGAVAFDASRFADAHARYQEAFVLAQWLRDPLLRARTLCNPIGSLGAYNFDDCVTAVQQVSELRMQSRLYYCLGVQVGYWGEMERARDCWKKAQRAAVERGSPYLRMQAQYALGVSELLMGRLAESRPKLEWTLLTSRELASQQFEVLSLAFLGILNQLDGQLERSHTLLEQATRVTAESNERWGETIAWAALSVLEARRDHLDLAEEYLATAKTAAGQTQGGSLGALLYLLEGAVDLCRARHAACGAQHGDAARYRTAAHERVIRLDELKGGRAQFPTLLGGPLLLKAIAEDKERSDAPLHEAMKERMVAPGFDLEVGPDAMWFRVRDGLTVGLMQRPHLQRLLLRLVEQHKAAPGERIPLRELLESGWPGEAIASSEAGNRLHNAMAVLSSLGLRALTSGNADGYLLDPLLAVSCQPSLSTTFGGRPGELARLTELLDAIPVIVLYGVAGVGKSTLVQAVAKQWGHRGVFHAALVGEPLCSIVDHLRRQLAGGPIAQTASDEERLADLAARLDDAQALCVLERLHHLGRETLQKLIVGLGQRLARGRLVATSRELNPGELQATGVATLRLTGLTRPEAQVLFSMLTAQRSPAVDFEVAWSRSHGNPLLLRKAHSGQLEAADPIAAAIHDLSREERVVAGALALTEVRVPPELLRSACPADADGSGLHRLVSKLIVEFDSSGHCVLHDLYRDALLKFLPQEEFPGIRENLARAMDQANLDLVLRVGEVTRHLRALDRYDEAGRYLLDKSREFIRYGATADLLNLLDAIPPHHRTAEIQVGRARTLMRLLRLPEAFEDLSRLVQAGIEPQQELKVAFGHVAMLTGHLEAGETALRELLQGPPLSPLSWISAHATFAMLRTHQGHGEEARAFLDAAPAPDPIHRRLLDFCRAFTLWLDERHRECDRELSQLRALCSEPLSFRSAMLAPAFLVTLLARQGQFSEATAMLQQVESALHRQQDLRLRVDLRLMRANYLYERGDRAAALSQFSELAAAYAEGGDLLGMLWSRMWRGRLLLIIGRRKEGLQVLDETARLSDTHGVRSVAAAILRSYEEDVHAQVQRLCAGAADLLGEPPPSRVVRQRALAMLWAAQRGDSEHVQVLTKGIAGVAEEPEYAVERAMIALARMVLARAAGRSVDAARALTEARTVAREGQVDDELVAELSQMLVGCGPARMAAPLDEPSSPAPLPGTRSSDVLLDARMHRLQVGAQRTVSLKERPVLRRLLYALAAQPGAELSKDELATQLGTRNYNPLRHDPALWANIRRLRVLLRGTGLTIEHGENGYCLQAPAQFCFIAPPQ